MHLSALMSSEHSIIPVSSECQHLFPAKIMSRLARWTTITHEDYMVHTETHLCRFLKSPLLIGCAQNAARLTVICHLPG